MEAHKTGRCNYSVLPVRDEPSLGSHAPCQEASGAVGSLFYAALDCSDHLTVFAVTPGQSSVRNGVICRPSLLWTLQMGLVAQA